VRLRYPIDSGVLPAHKIPNPLTRKADMGCMGQVNLVKSRQFWLGEELASMVANEGAKWLRQAALEICGAYLHASNTDAP